MPQQKLYSPQPAQGQAVLAFNGRRQPQFIEIFESSVVEEVRPAAPAQGTLNTENSAGLNDDFTNLLLHGDCLSACAYLKEKNIKLDLVYIDPPFASGANYAKKIFLRNGGKNALETGDNSLGEEVMYADIWQKEDYLNWLYERLLAIRDVMSETASIYVHLDWHIGHYAKILLDEVFGEINFRNEIIWHYPGREMHVTNKFNAKHDTIFFYAKSDDARVRMSEVATPYDKEERLKGLRRKVHKDENGEEWVWETRGQAAGQEPYKRYVKDIIAEGQALSDVWDDVQFLRGNDPDRRNYTTQKPEPLLERIIQASSDEGMVVADFFVGSGTTALAAQKLGRKFVACDVGVNAIQTTRDALVKEKAAFDVVKIHDGVLLFRNPAQTAARLFSLIDGFRPAKELDLDSFWDGALAQKDGSLQPLKLIGLQERLSREQLDVVIEQMAALEDGGQSSGVTLVFAYKDPEINQTLVNRLLRESKRTSLSVSLLSLSDLLGSRLDVLYAEDSVAVDVKTQSDGTQLVTIDRYYSSYLHKKVQEFNLQKVRKPLTDALPEALPQPLPEGGEHSSPSGGGEVGANDTETTSTAKIEISERGLELIEAVQFDTTLREDGVWISNPAIEDKAGPKEKIKGVYTLPSGPFKVKIRNIAGDELVWQPETESGTS